MKLTQPITTYVSKASTRLTQSRPKLSMMAAVMAIATSLSLAPIGLVGSASAQASTPQSTADCAQWRGFGFQNRAACISYVQTHPANGYGGNGGGNGGAIGSIGRLIASIFEAIAHFIRALFAIF